MTAVRAPFDAHIDPRPAVADDGALAAFQAPSGRNTLLIPLAFAVLGCAAFSIDVSVAHFARAYQASASVRRLLQYGELFGHAMGAGLILGAIALVDLRRRLVVPRLAACAFGAGLVADIVKISVERVRPAFLSADAASFVQTFGAWWPGLHGSHKLQSFPSAHTSVAVALAVALAACYPRARWIVAALAVLCGAHRVVVGAHYPSDVLFGAAVGTLTAAICLRSSWFLALERRNSPKADPQLAIAPQTRAA